MSGIGIIGAALAAGLSGAGEGEAQGVTEKMKEDATAQQIQEENAARLSSAEQLQTYQIQAQRQALMWKQTQIANMVQAAGDNAAAMYQTPNVSGDVTGTAAQGYNGGDQGTPPGFVGNAGIIASQIQQDPTISPADKQAALAQLSGQQTTDTTPLDRAHAAATMMANPATIAAAYAAVGDPAGAKDVLTGAASLRNADQKFELLNAKLTAMSQDNQTKAIAAVMAQANRNNPTQSAIDYMQSVGASPADIKQFIMRSVLPKQGSTFIPNVMGGGTEINHDDGSITQYDAKGTPTIIKPPSSGAAAGPTAGAVLVWDPAQGKLVPKGQ